MDDGKETALPEWLVSMLVCPDRKEMKLQRMTGAQLAGLNDRIVAGGVRDRGGKSVEEPIEDGLVREDLKVVYAIRGGIPDLIPDDGIDLGSGDIQ